MTLREHLPDYLASLAGGALIGLAATLYYWTHGRIAGVCGLVGKVIVPKQEGRGISAAFLAAMLGVGIVCAWISPQALSLTGASTLPLTLAGGVLVGFGTRLGNGCTSGHGVCGISRGSVRSIVATMTFMATGILTTYVVRHVIGGAR